MGYFNDVVVVADSDAEAVARARMPSTQWPGMELKSINIIDLDNLFRAVVPTEAQHTMNAVSRYLPELPVTKKRVAIHRFPRAFVESIAASQPKQLRAIAEAWSVAEEFRGGWPPEDLLEILRPLQELAKVALARNHSMLYVMAG